MSIRVLFAVFGLALVAAAQTEPPKTRPLSLQDCLQMALQKNLDLQIERFNPQIALFDLKAVYGDYNPGLSLSGQHNHDEAGSQLLGGGFTIPGSVSDYDSFSSGLGGLLPWGTRYNLQASTKDTYGYTPTLIDGTVVKGYDTNSTGGFFSANNVTVPARYDIVTTNFQQVPSTKPFENSLANVALNVTQPLLKNFWIDSTRLNIALGKNRVKNSELGVRQRVMDVATSVELAYYDLIFARENVKVQEKAVELARRLLEENKKRVEVGTLAPLDEKQAESEVSAREADLIAAQRTQAVAQNALKQLVSDDFADWNQLTLEPTESLSADRQFFDLQESWSKGLTLRPDLMQAKLALESQGIQLKYDRNQLYPQLDVVGSYGFNGSGREFSGALDEVGAGSRPTYYYGGRLVIPLGNTGARNRYKADKATFEQSMLTMKKLEQDIMISIDNAIKLAQANFDRVIATKKAVEYAQAALEAEQKKLENGKSTSFVVLRLARDLTSARSDEIGALTTFKRSLAQLAQAEGNTLERRGINLEVK